LLLGTLNLLIMFMSYIMVHFISVVVPFTFCCSIMSLKFIYVSLCFGLISFAQKSLPSQWILVQGMGMALTLGVSDKLTNNSFGSMDNNRYLKILCWNVRGINS
jgi:hypothetical protein